MTIKTAGIIIIGNEILSGRVKDENIYFLCQRFFKLGVKVDKIVSVGDDVADIAEEVCDFSKKFDLVITSGGVGPTHDDVTYAGVARAFDLSLEMNEGLLNYWKEDPHETEISAVVMSKVPKPCQIVYALSQSEERTPVVIVKNVFVFPGTPSQLRCRFISLEEEYFNGMGTKFYKHEIFLTVDESSIISELNETVNRYNDVSIGSYPEIDNPHYLTRLTIQSHDESKVNGAFDMLTSLIEPSWVLNPKSLKFRL